MQITATLTTGDITMIAAHTDEVGQRNVYTGQHHRAIKTAYCDGNQGDQFPTCRYSRPAHVTVSDASTL